MRHIIPVPAAQLQRISIFQPSHRMLVIIVNSIIYIINPVAATSRRAVIAALRWPRYESWYSAELTKLSPSGSSATYAAACGAMSNVGVHTSCQQRWWRRGAVAQPRE